MRFLSKIQSVVADYEQEKAARAYACEMLLHTSIPIETIEHLFMEQFPDHQSILDELIEDVQEIGGRPQ